MSQLISSFPIGTIFYQSGYGYPTHIATRGCTYIDVNTGIEYINKDGIVDWVPFLDGSTVITGGTATGDYLPLSGGTVSGATTFTSGITVNTISDVDYINFKTSPIVPNPTGGTLYFDSSTNSLSYKPITNNNDVTINIGQESLIRFYNETGIQINNGQALNITGSSFDTPTVTLAIANGGSNQYYQVDGVATHDVPNGEFGFMTVFGVVRDIDLSSFYLGEDVFLSQTIPGNFQSFSGLSFTGRTVQVGHVNKNTLLGELQINIFNESKIGLLTAKENNILSADNSSTGVFSFSGMSRVNSSQISITKIRGWIVDNISSDLDPSVLYVEYPGSSAYTITNINTTDITFLYLTSGQTITQSNIPLTEELRRKNIYLGFVTHPKEGNNILNAVAVPDYIQSPVSQLRDMFQPISLINGGVIPSANTGLTFNINAGYLYGLGINYTVDKFSPNTKYITAQSPAIFAYRTQTGGTGTQIYNIDPTNYDVGGAITPITGNKATNQRIYINPTGNLRIQYGQQSYSTLAEAIQNIQNESFSTFVNISNTGILIGILSVLSNCTDLNDTTRAQFHLVSKFGETVGAAGGSSTTNLQQAYNNSSPPEITTNSTLGGVSIKNGTGSADNVSNLFEGLNTAGSITSFIRADGTISGTTLLTNGFRANNNGITATTISATSVSLPFSSGSTLFAGTSGQISQNNSQFFWDNVNNRLGVGTNSPQAKLDVASSTGNTAIHITSSALTNSDINFINSGYPVPRWTIRGSGAANGSSGNLVFQRLAGTSVMSITENTNVLIGTTTDAGFKLDVNGTVRVQNSSFTGGITIAQTANNTGVITGGPASENITFGPSNRIFLNAGEVRVGFLGTVTQISSLSIGSISGTGINITSQAGFQGGANTTQNHLKITSPVALQNINPVFNALLIEPTINNASVTSGSTVRGIHYNPILTSLSGTTHRAIETVTGDVILGSTSGNVGIGTATDAGFKLDVSGTTRLNASTSIVGDISQTSSAFTGTHTIGFSANNSVRFTNSGIGQYMQVGPSNIVDFVGQQVRSVQRGANFGNSIAATSIVTINAFAAQSSGVLNSSGIELTYPINNTGTYSGITRGIFYSPTLTSLVGTTHRAIETVTGDVVLGSTSGSVLVGKTTNDGFRLDVSGTTRLSALTQNILTVIGSGNSTTSPIFSVQGSQGELFSVTDSLTGSLFSVNDISGLPILEVFSDNTTLMGNYLAPSLNTTARVTLTAGTNTIYSIPVSAYTGAFFDYTVASTGTTGVRAGTIMSVWSGSTAEFTDISTNDIGVTTGVTFSVTSNGTLARLSSSATTTGWIVKTIIRSI